MSVIPRNIIRGLFFDGVTSKSSDATLTIDDAGLVHLRTNDQTVNDHISQLHISPRIGNTPRYLYFPNGGRFETRENDAIDKILAMSGTGKGVGFIHNLESKLRYVLPTLIIVIVSSWAFVVYGIPTLAKAAAFALPAATSEYISREALEIMDERVFSPSELDSKSKKRLIARFNDITKTQSDEYNYQLVFRVGNKIGANAFALPSGTVVMTDELVEVARNDQEIVSVLAHEVGHVVNRHSLRRTLQGSVLALLIATFTGDTFSASTLIATLPTLLIESGYSRDFEREADQFSLDYLLDNKIDPENFGNLMVRLDEQDKEEGGGRNFFSTHPATSERVQMFKQGRTRKFSGKSDK